MRRSTVFSTLLLYFFCHTIFVQAKTEEKAVYKPSSFGNMDLNNTSSKWCYQRSKSSDNFIVFWEAGYGDNPKITSDSKFRVDVDAILKIAETSFFMYRDSMQFIEEGNSKTDQYKMIILLFYSTNWMASGSGVDDTIGLLNLSANAAQALGVTVAHEVGHCFQYQVACDGHTGGWRYGYGVNSSGGNGWWEQCAQWQAFKVFPNEQFSNYQFANYLKNAHKNILHEAPRYANYFIQDYWTFLHGFDFIGKLWKESKKPEDPVDAYKRLTNISQAAFNDQIYDCASRFVTWDIPALKEQGENYILSRTSNTMNLEEDGYWMIDPAACIENYGYNVIRLNVPESDDSVHVFFESKAGEPGFRNVITNVFSGWRYGLVGLMKDGSRYYSAMKSPTFYSGKMNPKDTLIVQCPDECEKLWLVITGAPYVHVRHPWDDDESNDEQWPYQVKFENTNIYGEFAFNEEDKPYNETLSYQLTLPPFTGNANPYPSTPVQPDIEQICRAFTMNLSELKTAIGSSVQYCAIQPNGGYYFNSTANAPGHWFDKDGYVTFWGSNSYIFSELNATALNFNIGQYPNRCKEGDQYSIKQGLVYTPLSGEKVTATLIFNIKVSNDLSTAVDDMWQKEPKSEVISSLENDWLRLTQIYNTVKIYNLSGKIIVQANMSNEIGLSGLPAGMYLMNADGMTAKFVKRH